MSMELGKPNTAYELETRMNARVAKYRDMTADLRIKTLAGLLEITAENLENTAACLQACKECGDDLSGLNLNGLRPWLEWIAQKKVLASAIFFLFSRPSRIIERVAMLPIEEQQHIANGGAVPLIVYRNGSYEVTQGQPLEMDEAAFRLAYDGPVRRSIAAQRQLVAEKAAKSSLPIPELAAGWEHDAERGGFRKGRQFLTYAEVEAMARLVTKARRKESA